MLTGHTWPRASPRRKLSPRLSFLHFFSTSFSKRSFESHGFPRPFPMEEVAGEASSKRKHARWPRWSASAEVSRTSTSCGFPQLVHSRRGRIFEGIGRPPGSTGLALSWMFFLGRRHDLFGVNGTQHNTAIRWKAIRKNSPPRHNPARDVDQPGASDVWLISVPTCFGMGFLGDISG